ncbi:MAG TPA: hypothetical protein VGJ55_08175 [Pyrinomonadaceae bacterium]|jgi:hypothetical protein
MSDKLQFVVGCVTVVIDKLKGVPIKINADPSAPQPAQRVEA